MIFNSLSVQNFGVFRGYHKFDLAPINQLQRKRLPIVVFVGHNGAGKSTLFQAIALALYGPLALSDRVSRQEYRDFLLGRMHRNNKGGAPTICEEAGIVLEIDYVRSGEPLRVRIARKWHRKNDRIDEKLEVIVNGKPVDVPPEDYQTWLNDQFPAGLLPTCFFDAEQLEALGQPRHTRRTTWCNIAAPFGSGFSRPS